LAFGIATIHVPGENRDHRIDANSAMTGHPLPGE
jgi:hypothetical protein